MKQTMNFRVPEYEEAKLKKLVSKLEDLKFGFVYSAGHEKITLNGIVIPVLTVSFTFDELVSGKNEKYATYTYLGYTRKEKAEDSPTLHRMTDDPRLLSLSFESDVLLCHHCNIKRQRNEYYFFADPDNNIVSIGNTCVNEFFGYDVAKILSTLSTILLYEETYRNDEDLADEYMRSGYEVGYSLKSCFVATKLATNDFTAKWISKESLEADCLNRLPTYTAIQQILSEGFENEEFRTEYKKDLPEKFLKSLVELKNTPITTDYLFNLKSSLFNAQNELREAPGNIAITCYFCLKAMTESKETYANSDFVSQIGQRLQLPVTVIGIKSFESFYGISTLYTFATKEGNVLKSFVSGSFCAQLGSCVEIKGTVKDHEEYNGRKETVLTRIKYIREVA